MKSFLAFLAWFVLCGVVTFAGAWVGAWWVCRGWKEEGHEG